MPKLENERARATSLVLPNGEAWIVGGMVQRSGLQEDIVNRCVVGHFDGAAWRFDEDDDCGPLGRVWGRAPNDVWADGGDVVHWNGRYPDQEPEGEARRDRRAVTAARAAGGWRSSGAAAARRGSSIRGGRRRAGRRARLLGVRPGRRLGDRRGRRADALRRQRWSRGDDPIALRAVAARAADDVWAIGAERDAAALRRSRLAVSGGCPGRPARSRRRRRARANDVWVLTPSERCCASTASAGRMSSSKPPKAGRCSRCSRARRTTSGSAPGAKLLHWNGRAIETFDLDFEPRQLCGATRASCGPGGRLHRWDGSKMVIPPETAPAPTARACSSRARDGRPRTRSGWWTRSGSRAFAGGRLEKIRRRRRAT